MNVPRIAKRSFKPVPARSSQSGFSLIEIIIVVVLIGGIVAFAANRIIGGGDRAKYSLAKSQVATLGAKIQEYEQNTGSLPGSLEDLVKDPGSATGWLGPYAKEAELKDPWNKPYVYRTPGESGPFDLMSLAKDGQPGGSSLDADIKFE